MTTPGFAFEQVLVVGGTGQTGLRLLELLREHDGARIIATSRAARADEARVAWRPLDLEADENTLAEQLASIGAALRAGVPTALIFAAAFANVDECEADPGRCGRVNERNTISVLTWARARFGARLVFFSTDYVFDGASGPYTEESPRHPLSNYGRAKAALEEWLGREAPDALVLRTTGIYDVLPGSKNFLMQLLERWKAGQPARVPCDQIGNPVFALELARATLELLARGAAGIFHVAGGAQLPRDEFARQIARAFGFDESLVVPVKTSELGQKARRPLKGGLSCGKLRQAIGWAPAAPAEILESLKWLPRG